MFTVNLTALRRNVSGMHVFVQDRLKSLKHPQLITGQ